MHLPDHGDWERHDDQIDDDVCGSIDIDEDQLINAGSGDCFVPVTLDGPTCKSYSDDERGDVVHGYQDHHDANGPALAAGYGAKDTEVEETE